MKRLIIFITIFSFVIQSLPVSYISLLLKDRANYVENYDNDDESDSIDEKDKTDKKIEIKAILYTYCTITISNTGIKEFPHFESSLPKEYFQTILVPPPNC